jgi:hypothetical protein
LEHAVHLRIRARLGALGCINVGVADSLVSPLRGYP